MLYFLLQGMWFTREAQLMATKDHIWSDSLGLAPTNDLLSRALLGNRILRLLSLGAVGDIVALCTRCSTSEGSSILDAEDRL